MRLLRRCSSCRVIREICYFKMTKNNTRLKKTCILCALRNAKRFTDAEGAYDIHFVDTALNIDTDAI